MTNPQILATYRAHIHAGDGVNDEDLAARLATEARRFAAFGVDSGSGIQWSLGLLSAYESGNGEAFAAEAGPTPAPRAPDPMYRASDHPVTYALLQALEARVAALEAKSGG